MAMADDIEDYGDAVQCDRPMNKHVAEPFRGILNSFMKPVALLPCPFCGEPAESDMYRGFVDYKYKHGNAVAIYCTKCNADMTLCHGDFPQHSPEELLAILIEQWNRRTNQP